MIMPVGLAQDTARYAFPVPGGVGVHIPASRQELYRTFESYLFNTTYEERGLSQFNAALAATQATVNLRGIFNPVASIVDFYQKYVLSGRLGEDGEDVDLTIDATNARIIPALIQVWRWSNLQIEKDLIPYYAANLGDCLLAVVDRAPARRPGDTVSAGRVWIEVRHPGELIDWDFDDRGNLIYAKLESLAWERDPSGVRTPFTYGRILTKAEYRTEKDRRPFAYPPNTRDRWPNPHGFVPLVLVQHKRIGDEFGLNAYHHGLAPIDELNLQASYLSTLIGQHLAPQWAIFGAELPAEGLARDGQVWGFPNGADAKALIADLRVQDAYHHLDAIRRHLEEQFPELAIPRLRDKSQLSGVAVRGMLTDLIRSGETARDNYEYGLVRAGQMALSMGMNPAGTRTPLPGFAGLGTFDNGDFDHRYVFPAILPLSDLEQLQVDAEKAALEREIASGTPVAPAPGQQPPAETPEQALARELGQGQQGGERR